MHDDDYHPILDVGLFLGKVLIVLVVVALFVGAILYAFWREIAIFSFLIGA